MRLTSFLLMLGTGAILVAAGLGIYEWYASQPPKIDIQARFPDRIEAGVEYMVPIVFENHTRRRMRIVGWNYC